MNIAQLITYENPIITRLLGGEIELIDLEDTSESLCRVKVQLELDLDQMEEY